MVRETAFQLMQRLGPAEGLVVVRRRQRTLRRTVQFAARFRGMHSASPRFCAPEPSAFGQVVLFVPYLGLQLFPYPGEHPASLLIQQRAAHEAAGAA